MRKKIAERETPAHTLLYIHGGGEMMKNPIEIVRRGPEQKGENKKEEMMQRMKRGERKTGYLLSQGSSGDKY